MVNLKDLAWCAGFLEGEGHIGLHKRGNSLRLYLSAGQVNRAPLDKLKRLLEGNVNGPYGGTQLNHKPYYQWSTTNSQAAGILMTLASFYSDPTKIYKILTQWKTLPVYKPTLERFRNHWYKDV